jgi:hypothetical protein
MNSDFVHEFITYLNKGSMPGVVYDTAIIGSLIDELGISRFPDQVKKTLSMQHDNGSWGSSYFNPFDRLLSTISSLYMITNLGLHKDPFISPSYEKGISWLESNFTQLLNTPYPFSGGFEILFPYYANEIAKKNNDLNINLSTLLKVREKKLSKIGDLIFNKATPILYSMEGIVEDEINAQKLLQFQSSNGSLAASPSATSLFINHNIKEAVPSAMRYIQESILPDQSVVHFNDYKYMNIAFSLYPLFKAGYQFGIQGIYVSDLLSEGWTENGISFGQAFPVPDSDDTAVALVNLHNLGFANTSERLDILLKYEDENHFKTYFEEIDPAMMTNIHILEAFLEIPHPRREEIVEKLIKFIRNNKEEPRKVSKFNSSRVIQYVMLILSMYRVLPEFCTQYIEYLIDQLKEQMDNQDENILLTEEFAHLLLALLYAKKYGYFIDSSLLTFAYEVVLQNFKSKKIPVDDFTWTAKIQYFPTQIFQAYEIAALMLYNELME